MTRMARMAGAAFLLLLVASAPAAAETYAYAVHDSYGSSTLGGSYGAYFHMTNTPTSADCDAHLAVSGSWMGTSYSVFTAAYTATQTLGTGTADATVTYMGSVVYHTSLSKSWTWSWSKSKTVFTKSATFSVFSVPVTVSTDCKWSASASLSLALTPTGCGADGSAKFALTASGSAGITIPFVFSGTAVLKVTVIELKPSGELEANFTYLHALGSVSAKASYEIHLVVTLFGFTITDTTLYKTYPYDHTWAWTKHL